MANPFDGDVLSDHQILRMLYAELKAFREDQVARWENNSVKQAQMQMQLTETNGRVKKHDLFVAQVKGAIFMGGMILLPVATGVLTYALTNGT